MLDYCLVDLQNTCSGGEVVTQAEDLRSRRVKRRKAGANKIIRRGGIARRFHVEEYIFRRVAQVE